MQASPCSAFSCCGAQARGFSNCSWRLKSERRLSSFGAQGLLLCYSVAHGIFQDQEQTGDPCIARRILNHWSTREAPADLLIWDFCPPRLRKSVSVVLNPLVCGPLLQQPQETRMSTKCQTEGSCGKQEGNPPGTESKSLEETKEETGRNAS